MNEIEEQQELSIIEASKEVASVLSSIAMESTDTPAEAVSALGVALVLIACVGSPENVTSDNCEEHKQGLIEFISAVYDELAPSILEMRPK